MLPAIAAARLGLGFLARALATPINVLRDFLYDPELLAHEQVDEKALPGLRGVVKISHTVMNGIALINLDGFAPASQWEELSAAPVPSASRSNTEEATR